MNPDVQWRHQNDQTDLSLPPATALFFRPAPHFSTDDATDFLASPVKEWKMYAIEDTR